MKKIILALTLISHLALAEQKLNVTEVLTDVKFDGQTLQTSYAARGGSQTHSTAVELVVDSFTRIAHFEVFNITAEVDQGGRVLVINSKTNIRTQLDQALQKYGSLRLQLPVIIMNQSGFIGIAD